MSRNGKDFSKTTLSDSYDKNYSFFIEDKENLKNNLYLFNGIPVFKYEKLILKYDIVPTKEDIKREIQGFLDKIKDNENFKVFSIKGNVFLESETKKIYVINVVFVNFNL